MKKKNKMAHLQNTPSNFDELEEGEIREEEKDLLTQVEEKFQERLQRLLSMQDLELKKFKILKNAHEMEFQVNCKLKVSNLILDFEILKKKFERHMKTQYRNFVAMQIEVRNKERVLKENWVEMAKNGNFDVSFFEIPIPDSSFTMKRFDYESEMRVLLSKNGTSPNESNPNPNLDPIGPTTLDKPNPNPTLESEEVLGKLDETACDNTTLKAPSPNPNPNSLMSVMPSPNLESEEALEKADEVACDVTALNLPNPIFPPITTIQSPNLETEVTVVEAQDVTVIEKNVQNPNPRFTPVIEHEDNVNLVNEAAFESSRDQIDNIISDSTAHVSNISQINHPIPPDQLVASSNMVSDNIVNESKTPSSNQNVPPVQEPAAQFPAGDMGVVNQLLRLMPQVLHENPLQNELAKLHKLDEVITQKHELKRARTIAERDIEIEEVTKKYRQVAAELDSEWSHERLNLKMRYATLFKQQRLAQEFREIYHNAPPLHVNLPLHGSVCTPATPMAARRPATSNPVASPYAAQRPPPVSLPVRNHNSASQSFVSRPGLGGILRAPAPHMIQFRLRPPTVSTTNVHMDIGDFRST